MVTEVQAAVTIISVSMNILYQLSVHCLVIFLKSNYSYSDFVNLFISQMGYTCTNKMTSVLFNL